MSVKNSVSAILIAAMLVFPCAALSEGYTAGTYSATARGFGGDVSVQAVFDENGIVGLTITGDDETPNIGGAALDTLREQVLEKQGTQIDGVTGATLTTNAVIDAVGVCMQEASGMVDEAREAADGVYTGSAFGFMSEIQVKVTIADHAIADIEVTQNGDTGMIGGAAGQLLADAIVEHQSLAVDAVSGATVTSNAVFSAVTQALDAAGADVNALRGASVAKRAPETVEMNTQIVVIGAGMAGITAAIEASEAGADVILLERSGVFSSSTTRSEGMVMGAGTTFQKEHGIEDDPEDMFNDMYALYSKETTLDANLLRKAVNESAGLIDWLIDHGIVFESVHPISALEPRNDARSHISWKKGDGLMEKLVEAAEKVDTLTIYMNTRAIDLIMEDGAAVGVKAVNEYGDDITIHAEATILCTGSYGANIEMIKELNPTLFPLGYSGWGDGDGYVMAQKAGAKMIQIGYMAGNFIYAPSGKSDLTQPYPCSPTLPLFNIIQVNTQGKRLINEDAFTFDFGDLMYDSGDPVGWAIVGKEYLEQYPSHYEDGKDTVFNVNGKEYKMAYQADTIEELAEMTGMDAQTLRATIERYNASCDAGIDEEFGKDPQYMERVDAPYTALLLCYTTSDGFSGCAINENAQVIDTEGEVIPGLYAAGTCAISQIIGNRYYGCGSIIMTCGVFGRTAGAHAVTTLH